MNIEIKMNDKNEYQKQIFIRASEYAFKIPVSKREKGRRMRRKK